MKRLLAVLLFALSVAMPASAEPLPKHKGTHFYAIQYCGEFAGVIWLTEDKVYLLRLAQIRNQETIDMIMAAREKAEEDGQAYVIDVAGQAACPEV